MVNLHYDDYESNLRKIDWKTIIEKKGKKTISHINNIFAFDIETSSGYITTNNKVIPFSHDFWENEYKTNNDRQCYKNYKKAAVMYHWQIAVESANNINVFAGRTWDEFKDFLNVLNEVMIDKQIFGDLNIDNYDTLYRDFMIGTGKVKRINLHFYVHNLGFEMQFLRNIFEIKNVFARTSRKPMKFLIKYEMMDIMFHDTLCLTQKSLSSWAKDANLKIQKLKGDLDYLVIRNSKTKLTQKEIDYCVNDVALMVEGLQVYRKKYNNKLTNIPMTQTGEVRIVCQNKISVVNTIWAESCYNIDHSYSFDFFNRLLSAFMGGWTHANEKYSGQLQGMNVRGQNVVCYDFASSYPSVMTSAKFPVSEFREIDETRLNYLESLDLEDSDYRYMIVVELFDVESKLWNSFYSSSKCIEIDEKSAILDNGKIVATDYMKVCVTDTDWDIIKRAYDFSSYNILEAYEADADYIPLDMINVILNYFSDKTALKGTGSLSSYLAAKQFINSIYGCCVTKIVCDEVIYNLEGWSKHRVEKEDFEELMKIPDKESKKLAQMMKKFTTYQIGVWIPAFARHRLWDAIFQFDNKVIYCDTDSVKGYFDDNDIKWFDDYNKHISELQQKVADFYGFDISRYSPKTANGVSKQLGIFEREEDCYEFKALRAKVYAAEHIEKDGTRTIETTIAGLPKSSGVKLIKKVDDLNDGLFWTPRLSEKLCANYIENQGTTVWTDEQGNTETYNDKYGIMLEPIGFDLSIASDYEYLLGILNSQVDNDYLDTPEILRNYWEGKEND